MSEIKVNKITPTTTCGTVTLGDSGDTLAIPCGVTLSNAGSITNSGTITNTGTISGGTITGTIDNQVNWDTTAKTAGFTAVAGNGYFVNTTSGAITVTLPASPSAGDLVGIKDYANTADTNNITIARNGENIQGTANDFIINTEGAAVTLFYVDATQGWVTISDSIPTDVQTPKYITATGGTVTCCGDYKIHTFTGPGTFTVTCAGNVLGSNSVDYLVIAGGAGGGPNGGGGGGAGGYRAAIACESSGGGACSETPLPVSATGYPITVGAGGTASPTCGTTPGSNSIFDTVTSTGGGAGGKPASGSPGGSGGGATGPSGVAGTGTTNEGFAGGAPGLSNLGGGGGGAGSVGATGSPTLGGNGGSGVTSSITGSPVGRGGGGGGGTHTGGPGNSTGTDGGGNGGVYNSSATADSGDANTGGGGGGGGGRAGAVGSVGGAGGSGIVIIRYKYQ